MEGNIVVPGTLRVQEDANGDTSDVLAVSVYDGEANPEAGGSDRQGLNDHPSQIASMEGHDDSDQIVRNKLDTVRTNTSTFLHMPQQSHVVILLQMSHNLTSAHSCKCVVQWKKLMNLKISHSYQ